MIDDEATKTYPKKAKPLNQHDKLERDLKTLMKEYWKPELSDDLPKKWKLSGTDLLILPESCFTSDAWSQVDRNEFWRSVADCFRVRRICKETRVKPDGFRTPNLDLVFGDDSVVTVVNNGIKYSYDVTKSMFCWGNITEKLRLAAFDCSNETVVDLFAGIGYFTLVYLIHCKAAKVIACEWNPASVEALTRNLILNKIEPERCEILQGDNRETCPQNCADRVNLGLIPTSEDSWPVACRALKKSTGGFLHIHGNVDVKTNAKSSKKSEWNEWSEQARNRIKELLDERTREENIEWSVDERHVEYVKSYGPRVDHLVLDLECRPKIKDCLK